MVLDRDDTHGVGTIPRSRTTRISERRPNKGQSFPRLPRGRPSLVLQVHPPQVSTEGCTVRAVFGRKTFVFDLSSGAYLFDPATAVRCPGTRVVREYRQVL